MDLNRNRFQKGKLSLSSHTTLKTQYQFQIRDKEGCSDCVRVASARSFPAFAAAAPLASMTMTMRMGMTTGNAGIDGGNTSVSIMSEAAIPPIRIFLEQCVYIPLVALSCHEQPALENPQIARCISARGRQAKGATISALFFLS
jgi:hypothetical protein